MRITIRFPKLGNIFVLTVLSVGIAGCSASAPSVGTGNAAQPGPLAAQPFSGLPGPAPSYDASYDPATMWTGSGAAFYSPAQIRRCKDLGLQSYVVRLWSDPLISQGSDSAAKVDCAWNGVEVIVDNPISEPASQGWDALVGSAPLSSVNLGGFDEGTDSNVTKIPAPNGGGRYFGTEKTANAVYYLDLFYEQGSATPDAFYKGAIAEMLPLIVKGIPSP